MKTDNTKWYAIAAICFILAVIVLTARASGVANFVNLHWTFTPEIVVYYDYDTNGTPIGPPKTYTNWPDAFILRGTNQAGSLLSTWPAILSVPAFANGQPVTNLQIGPVSGTMFFTLTASNSVGESKYSNTTFNTNLPNNPSSLKASLPPIPGR